MIITSSIVSGLFISSLSFSQFENDYGETIPLCFTWMFRLSSKYACRQEYRLHIIFNQRPITGGDSDGATCRASVACQRACLSGEDFAADRQFTLVEVGGRKTNNGRAARQASLLSTCRAGDRACA